VCDGVPRMGQGSALGMATGWTPRNPGKRRHCTCHPIPGAGPRNATRAWLVEGLRAEVETVVAKLQSDANARVERTKREAAARIARVEAEAESRVRHFQGELAQAQQLTDQAKAETRIAHDRIARVETEANERSLFSSLFFFDPPNRFVQIPQDLS
jgi:hypothetical protein